MTANARTKRTWSFWRIAQMPHWHVNELMISRIVAGRTSGSMSTWNASSVSGLIGGHCGAFARTLK